MKEEHDLIKEPSYESVSQSGPLFEGKRVLNHSDTFGIFNSCGDVKHNTIQNVQGVYHRGTRYISYLDFLLNEENPVLLRSAIKEQNEKLSVDLTNSEFQDLTGKVIPQGHIHIQRKKFIRNGGCYEEVTVNNYHSERCYLTLSILFRSDYKDIFEIRGTPRKKVGKFIETDDPSKILYRGLDNITRWLDIETYPEVTSSDHDRITYTFELPPFEHFYFYYSLKFHADDDESPRPSFEVAKAELFNDLEYHKEVMANVHTGNEQFTHWIKRSRIDLISLLSRTSSGYMYPYAGVPWYNTAFGRDGILTAYQTLWLAPNITKQVLLFLASRQASSDIPSKDAEPGKILHETRYGEMANTGEIPFSDYYGTIDATPLFVMLAGAYYIRTNDRDTIGQIWPNIERAMEWIDRYGDLDNDGFIEYEHKAHNGLINQGWKDSYDAVSDEHGHLAKPPIALCEVQGYVYDAKQKAALMAKALDKPGYAEWEASAAKLKKQFNEKFWDEELQTYVLALDADKKPCRVKSSNAGQCLFTGIVDASKAGKLAGTLLSKEMFSGWGIRTLSADAPRYNPMSYHNGSVWPHDVALIAEGLARYNCQEEVLHLLKGLFDASLFIEYQRLPELFCGFSSRRGEGPTDYLVACSPQAWSVAAVFMLLKACLRIEIDATQQKIYFCKPKLPEFLNYVRIEDLSIGAGREMRIELYRYPHDVGITTTGKPEDWQIIIQK